MAIVINIYNGGVVGLINIPTESFDEGTMGITVYDGTPDQRLHIIKSIEWGLIFIQIFGLL